MVKGIFHRGSGLGNQLQRYIMCRVLALDNGYDFSMVAPELFKGTFMNLDMGIKTDTPYTIEEPSGKVIINEPIWEEKTNYYNPEINFIKDDIVIDGEFQDERYFGHRLKEINEWLKVEPLEMPDDICVIGFRGGEFQYFPDLFLTIDYWNNAIWQMQNINPKMRFKVVTDDPTLAQVFFPDYEITHEIGNDWRQIRYAKYAIIANSSFYILPRLLNGGVTIAPRYWARHNTKEWSMPQNYYKSFQYI